MPHLDHWSLVGRNCDAFTAPEIGPWHLHGVVSGHANRRVADGMAVVTSPVTEIRQDLTAAITRNSYYTLGTVDHAFASALARAGLTVREFIRTVKL